MRQFTKFKQFADRTFVRPEKTVLSDNLLEDERHIEVMKLACESTIKKISACVNQGAVKEGATYDKKLKKVPECALGYCMQEFGVRLGADSVLGNVLSEASKIELKIGNEVVNYESKVEPIVNSIQTLLDNDFPNLYKMKRNLAKLAESMETAKSKLTQASRQSMNNTTGGKLDNCKDELEDSTQKVEHCKDQFAAEMFTLMAKESDVARSVVDFLKYQQEYHETISDTLRLLLPDIESSLTKSTHKPVYGVNLASHLSESGRTIAYPLELSVCALLETALNEEGLFRIAGSASKVKLLKAAFDAGKVDLKALLSEFTDPHVIGNALKSYFRELPIPLLTFELLNEWMTAIGLPESREKLEALWTVVHKLPEGNRANLRYLVKFLKLLSSHQESNKMSPANIAIVIGPNLLWSESTGGENSGTDSHAMGLNMTMTHLFSSILDQLISHSDWFFPDDINFYVTCQKLTEQELSNSRRASIRVKTPNGSGGEDEESQDVKRSQSSNSLEAEEQSSPFTESPMPILRKKIKPAPLPPILTPKNSDENPTKNNFGEIKTTKDKREGGMWIPPSPSQVNNRKSYTPSPFNSPNAVKTIGVAPNPSKNIPPKPPQPSFSSKSGPVAENSLGSTSTSASPIRYQSSFRTPGTSKVETKTDESGVKSDKTQLHYTASLPRHFTTENSYKTKNSPSPPPKLPPEKTESTESSSKNDKIGFESIESEARNEITDNKRPLSSESREISENRPVPAPRSSLVKEVKKTGEITRERPSVMAKPRDLTSSSGQSRSESRNSSGSGLDAEDEKHEGEGMSSSTTTASISPRSKQVLATAEEASNVDVFGNAEVPLGSLSLNSMRMPYRPPRPNPPPPPSSNLNPSQKHGSGGETERETTEF